MSLYFISDLHLSEDCPQIVEGFHAYIESLIDTDIEALYILGDFFEYWVGDDDRRPLITDVSARLNKLAAQGTTIYFQHGNRDFLLGAAYAKASSMHLLDDEHVIDYQGTRYLLMHGDSLCTDDTEYMAFRAQVRNPEWQAQILALSLQERYALAQQMRDGSQQHMGGSEDIADVVQSSVNARMQANAVHHLIHGHTHRPNKHSFELKGKKATRNVLGDWSNTHGWQIILNNRGLELSLFNFARL